MGITWAVGWAIGGILIGVTSVLLPGLPWESFFRVFDAPLPALAVPGFFAGMLFSIVLGFAARDRRFDELSLPVFAAWGALGGVLLSLLPNAMVAVGLATPAPGSSMWRATAVISGPFILFSAISAAGSLLLARRAARRGLPAADDEIAAINSAGPTDGELLTRGDTSGAQASKVSAKNVRDER